MINLFCSISFVQSQVHIIKAPQVPSKLREHVTDYVSLAKTRLMDLKVWRHLEIWCLAAWWLCNKLKTLVDIGLVIFRLDLSITSLDTDLLFLRFTFKVSTYHVPHCGLRVKSNSRNRPGTKMISWLLFCIVSSNLLTTRNYKMLRSKCCFFIV